MSSPKTRVAVVFGGRSSEHTISCVSAGSVLANLDQDRFEMDGARSHPGIYPGVLVGLGFSRGARSQFRQQSLAGMVRQGGLEFEFCFAERLGFAKNKISGRGFSQGQHLNESKGLTTDSPGDTSWTLRDD